jgi:hypothetical protein
MSIAAEHNPGFSPGLFAQSIAYLHRVPDREFAAYGTSQQQINRMREIFDGWERDLQSSA